MSMRHCDAGAATAVRAHQDGLAVVHVAALQRCSTVA